VDVPSMIEGLESAYRAGREDADREWADKIRSIHAPREVVSYSAGLRVLKTQCGYCADLCHSRSGLGCDSPDAPWPCETAELLEADQPVGSGVVQPVEERQPE
jgi:hypothetical protein